MGVEPEDPVMLSALQHWSYCPRQCGLIHLEQAFAENIHTMRGNAAHERVDTAGYEVFEGVRSERAMPVWSERLGLIGKCDVVEFHPDGRIYPVEYKHGRKRSKAHDDIQLAAQALCLEEMFGKPILAGAIWHHGSRRRREVGITADLRQQVTTVAARIREMLRSGALPAAVRDARCRECSLNDICQPEIMGNPATRQKLAETLYEPED